MDITSPTKIDPGLFAWVLGTKGFVMNYFDIGATADMGIAAVSTWDTLEVIGAVLTLAMSGLAGSKGSHTLAAWTWIPHCLRRQP